MPESVISHVTPGGASPNYEARPISVACVDADTMVREGLQILLPVVQVTATFGDIESFLADSPPADVVLLDIRLRPAEDAPSGAQGRRAVTALAGAGYRILIHTNERRRHVLVSCLAAGAQGLVHKSDSIVNLSEALTRVAAGENAAPAALEWRTEVASRRGRPGGLSPRQQDVLRARARGESFKSIGARLYIAPKTAEEYMSEVTRRFADYLRDHSPADLERRLGIGVGDLLYEDDTATATATAPRDASTSLARGMSRGQAS